jgi:hypothetical protein
MASALIDMSVRLSRSRQYSDVKRHVTALRAFHTGLIAETHRHLHALQQMVQYIDVLRHPTQPTQEKLAAAEASCRELKSLERLRQPWRDTYRDFRTSLRRARTLLRGLVGTKPRGRRRRNRPPTVEQ